METVKVYSPINDESIQKNLEGSPIWKGLRYHESELTEALRNKNLFEYSFKFDGLKAVQFTGVKVVK